jgi:hypothetical protein
LSIQASSLRFCQLRLGVGIFLNGGRALVGLDQGDGEAAVAASSPLDVGQTLVSISQWSLCGQDPVLAQGLPDPSSLSNRVERLVGAAPVLEPASAIRAVGLLGLLGGIMLWLLVPGFVPVGQGP